MDKYVKNFPHEKILWHQYVWSLLFFLIIVWEWFIKRDFSQINSPMLLLITLVNPILIYFISYSILPQTENDYSFESQKSRISILTIMWTFNKFILSGNSLLDFTYSKVEYILIITIYIILFFDKREFIWKISSVVVFLFFISLFAGFIGHINLIAFLMISVLSYFLYIVLIKIIRIL